MSCAFVANKRIHVLF